MERKEREIHQTLTRAPIPVTPIVWLELALFRTSRRGRHRARVLWMDSLAQEKDEVKIVIRETVQEPFEVAMVRADDECNGHRENSSNDQWSMLVLAESATPDSRRCR
jgi:hypothetical protein